jgi:hypothetical protein
MFTPNVPFDVDVNQIVNSGKHQTGVHARRGVARRMVRLQHSPLGLTNVSVQERLS